MGFPRQEYLNTVKTIYEKPTTNIILNAKLKAFPLRSGTKQRCQLSPLLFMKCLAMVIRKKKKKERKEKGNPVGKEVKSSLFADDVMLYIENPKDATRKLIELINEFGKVAIYKISTHRLVSISIN